MRPGTHKLQIATDCGNRDAICFVPTTISVDLNVVLALHGAGTCADAMVKFSGLNQLANERGWVLVYPNGSGRSPEARTWNARPDCGYAGRRNIDDVAFIDQLLDELTVRLATRTVRFFATGMSNGGMMSYRLANAMPERIRAIASVAGVMPTPPATSGPPVSVLHLHGTLDEYVPFEGGKSPQNQLRQPMLSASQSVESWARRNECSNRQPVRTPLAGTTDDGTSIEFWDFATGRSQSRVQLYRILGGGHTWPGRPSEMAFLGPTTRNLDANAVIGDFFSTVDFS